MIARRLRTISRSTLWLLCVAAFAPSIGASIGTYTDIPWASSLAGGSPQPASVPVAATPPQRPGASQAASASSQMGTHGVLASLGVDPAEDPYAVIAAAETHPAVTATAPRTRGPRRPADLSDPWDPMHTIDVGTVSTRAWLDIDSADPWSADPRSADPRSVNGAHKADNTK